MKTLAATFLLLAASAAFGQTVKTLGYNTTNGHVVYSGTNALTFTNAIGFSTNAAATTRTNLGVARAPIFKVLTNDFSITNQTNMTVVDGLTISTEAGKAYIFELFPITSASAASTSFQIVATNATVYGNWDGEGVSSYTTNRITNVLTRSPTDARVLLQKFYVTAGTNAGSVSFQFSSPPPATNTNTIGAGSYMLAQEVTPTP